MTKAKVAQPRDGNGQFVHRERVSEKAWRILRKWFVIMVICYIVMIGCVGATEKIHSNIQSIYDQAYSEGKTVGIEEGFYGGFDKGVEYVKGGWVLCSSDPRYSAWYLSDYENDRYVCNGIHIRNIDDHYNVRYEMLDYRNATLEQIPTRFNVIWV